MCVRVLPSSPLPPPPMHTRPHRRAYLGALRTVHWGHLRVQLDPDFARCTRTPPSQPCVPGHCVQLSGSWDGTCRVWDLAIGLTRHSFGSGLPGDAVHCLRWAVGAPLAAVGTRKSDVCVWDLTRCEVVQSFR
jgi:WD40 repeat protein